MPIITRNDAKKITNALVKSNAFKGTTQLGQEQEIQNQINTFLDDLSGETKQVEFICPIDGKKKKLTISRSFLNRSKAKGDLSYIQVPKGIICEHDVIAQVDNNFAIQGYIKPLEFYEDEYMRKAMLGELQRATPINQGIGEFSKLLENLGKANSYDAIKRELEEYSDKIGNVEAVKTLELEDHFVKAPQTTSTGDVDYGDTIQDQMGIGEIEFASTGYLEYIRYKYLNSEYASEVLEQIKTQITSIFSTLGQYAINSLGTVGRGIEYGVEKGWEHRNDMLMLAGSVGTQLKRFDCMIGYMPLTHVTSIEIAHSGRVLKFRASGSVFLAHQEGGKDAIRVEGYFYKNEVLFGLLGLWVQFLWMSGDIEEIDENDPLDYGTEEGLRDLRKKMSTARAYRSEVVKPHYKKFRTLPFVSQHVIIPNTYIETFNFEDRVVDGRDVLKYTLLLRTYEEPENIQVYEHENTDLKYAAPQHSYQSTTNMVTRFTINSVRRSLQASGLYLRERINRDTVLYAKDVYYNIDAFDIGATFALNAMGLGAGYTL